jgi:drug/metabolite transporter (DMT)-like permease
MLQPTLRVSKELYGRVAIFSSTFCFYLATVLARWATSKDLALSSAFLVFGRVLLGFLFMAGLFLLKRQRPRPCQYHFLLGRAIMNTLAVFCLYKAVEVTTVAQANILNMTYPLFIAVLSWALFRAQRDIQAVVMAFVAFGGIVLVLSPGELRLEWNSLWGLASGITAAVAIIFLKLARQQNDTETILLILFGVGTTLIYIVFRQQFHIPNPVEWFYLISCGGMGIVGQYLLTLGYRYVTAVEGSIISSFIIFLAAILGPVVTSDPALTVSGWIGALIIFGTDIYFILRRSSA